MIITTRDKRTGEILAQRGKTISVIPMNMDEENQLLHVVLPVQD